MQVVIANSFKRTVKKLHANQKQDLDKAIEAVMDKPSIGVKKTGDLSGLLVYKFSMVNQLTLLLYSHDGEKIIITFLAFGPHENFYRDLKN